MEITEDMIERLAMHNTKRTWLQFQAMDSMARALAKNVAKEQLEATFATPVKEVE